MCVCGGGGEVWKKLLNFNALCQGVKGSRRDDGIVCVWGGGGGGEVWKKLLNFNALCQGVKGSRRDDGIVCGEGGGDSVGVHRPVPDIDSSLGSVKLELIPRLLQSLCRYRGSTEVFIRHADLCSCRYHASGPT